MVASVPELVKRTLSTDWTRDGEAFGQLGLRFQRGGIVGAVLKLGRHRLGDRREGMPMDQRRVVIEHVDIGIAVEIGKGVALAFDDGERIGRVKRDGAGIAARHRLPARSNAVAEAVVRPT